MQLAKIDMVVGRYIDPTALALTIHLAICVSDVNKLD